MNIPAHMDVLRDPEDRQGSLTRQFSSTQNTEYPYSALSTERRSVCFMCATQPERRALDTHRWPARLKKRPTRGNKTELKRD